MPCPCRFASVAIVVLRNVLLVAASAWSLEGARAVFPAQSNGKQELCFHSVRTVAVLGKLLCRGGLLTVHWLERKAALAC